MVKIPQHGPSGQLFDMNTFFHDVDAHVCVNSWLVEVCECLGDGALAFEARTKGEVKISDAAFRYEYRGIYQTIDGSFIAQYGGNEQLRLEVFDSSYWEIQGSHEFETYMLGKYGAYHYKYNK